MLREELVLGTCLMVVCVLCRALEVWQIDLSVDRGHHACGVGCSLDGALAWCNMHAVAFLLEVAQLTLAPLGELLVV